MVSVPKVIGSMSCVFLLCLGLSSTDSAALDRDNKVVPPTSPAGREGGQAGRKGELDKMKASQLVSGQVLRIEGDNYFVKGRDGKEVRLHTDPTTEKIGDIRQGDRIEADVDNESHVLAIRPVR